MASDSSVIKSLSCYVCYLDARGAFEKLSSQEKLYAHYMARYVYRLQEFVASLTQLVS